MSDSAPRRRKGEGSISRVHDHPTCPAVGPDRVRPEHNCKGRYRARIWVTTMTGNRTRPTMYGKSEPEVIRKLKELTAKDVTNNVTEGRTTVEDWLRTDAAALGLANYWAELVPTLKVNTRKGYSSMINHRLIPKLGHLRLDKVTGDHIAQLWTDMRNAGLTEGTLRRHHAVLAKAFKVAVRRGKMSRNPCEMTEPPSTKVTTKRRPLTVEEAWRVLKLAGDNPRFWLALFAGVRQGEALGLRWRDVHLDVDGDAMPFIVVAQALSWDEDGQPVFDTPKSDESTDRVVPLVPPVASRLKKLRATAFAAGATADDLVFPNPRTRRAMDNRRDWLMWTTLLELAGIEHTQLHAARNTTANLLENAGVPDRVVAAILGHATVQQTHNYQGGNVAALLEAMEKLGIYLDTSERLRLEKAGMDLAA